MKLYEESSFKSWYIKYQILIKCKRKEQNSVCVCMCLKEGVRGALTEILQKNINKRSYLGEGDGNDD